jgi:hypothetical protein
MINEPKKALWQFQTYLNEIHDWNMEKVNNEIHIINTNSGCDYLEDLLTAVFIAHTKVLTAIRLSANNKKIEITIPKVDHFLFKVLCEVSKLLWSSTYLFREDISGVDRQQNYKAIEGIINEGIIQAIRSLVPVKTILKNLVNQEDKKDGDSKDAKEEDSDDEDVQVAKPAIELKPATEVATAATAEVAAEVAPLIELEEPSTLTNTISSIAAVMDPITSAVTSSLDALPTIINLDEKPKVSFASFNSMFSSEDPEQSNMVEDTTPDLEIIEDSGSALSSGDFDELNEMGTSIDTDDYEEL